MKFFPALSIILIFICISPHRLQAQKSDELSAQERLAQQREERRLQRANEARSQLEPEIKAIERLIASGHHREALRQLSLIARKIEPLVDARIQGLLAEIALIDKMPGKAIDFTQTIINQDKADQTYDPASFGCRYAYARACLMISREPSLHKASLVTSKPSSNVVKSEAKQDVLVPSNQEKKADNKDSDDPSFFGIKIEGEDGGDESRLEKKDDASLPRERSKKTSEEKPVGLTSEQITKLYAEKAYGIMNNIVVSTHRDAQLTPQAFEMILAAEFCGQAFVLMEQPLQAIKTYEFAIAYASADEYVLYELTEDRLSLVTRLRKGLNEARLAWDMQRYGKAFVKYRQAERLRANRQYAKASDAYNELIIEYNDTLWADAAAFYRAQCALDRGEVRVAAILWQKFVFDEPNGLYRGEALIAMGDLTLEYQLDGKGALKRYQEAIAWLDGIKAHDKRLPPEQVEARARQVAAAAETEFKTDGWGNVVEAKNAIGAVINRSNTPWYLDRLRYQTHLKIGITHAALGNNAEAKKAFAVLEDFDARQQQKGAELFKWQTTSERLVNALNPENNGPRNENDQLKVFKSDRRVIAYLGNMSYDALEWDKARVLFKRLLDGELGKLTVAEEAYTVYLLGNIEHMAGNPKSAIAHLKRFENDDSFRLSPIAAKALYTYGAIACQYRMDCKEYEKTWQRVLPLVVKRYPRSPHAEHAMFYFGFACYHTDREELAREAFGIYMQKFPDGEYIELATEYTGGK